MTRPLLSSWQGSPCPCCGEALRYAAERTDEPAHLVLVLLACPQGHCWEEQLSLHTFRSSIFVTRKPELEPYPQAPPAPPVSQKKPPARARGARAAARRRDTA
jgi:hypothetical protein